MWRKLPQDHGVPDLAFDPRTRHLRTARLSLRPLRQGDAAALLRIYADPEVTRYYELETMTEVAQAQRLLDFFLQHHDRYAMVDSHHHVIGTCGLFFWDQVSDMASFGYDLSSRYWGQGLMREAAVAVLADGFVRKRLNRVNALTAVDNRRSMSVLERLGFVEEAVLRQFSYWKGAYHDMRMFSLLRQDLGDGDIARAMRVLDPASGAPLR